MSSLTSRFGRQAAGQPDSGELRPPDLSTLRAAPFGDQDRARLASWLRERAWPREHMDIATLEGYLVALIAWPVGISPGAWIPPIWGERGWKVPRKLAGRAQYEDFVGLVVGLMRDLDGQLSRHPARFESSVLRGQRDRSRIETLHCWGKGFMTALTLGSQGLKSRNAEANAAVRVIAGAMSAPAPRASQATDDVISAALLLMSQRTSRGPLGAFDTGSAGVAG